MLSKINEVDQGIILVMGLKYSDLSSSYGHYVEVVQEHVDWFNHEGTVVESVQNIFYIELDLVGIE